VKAEYDTTLHEIAKSGDLERFRYLRDMEKEKEKEKEM